MKYKSLLLLLSISISLHAQETVNLSHYVFPDFQPGVVLLKNGVRNNAKLNYNAASEEMVFDENGKMLAIGDAVLPQIDTVFVSTSRKSTCLWSTNAGSSLPESRRLTAAHRKHRPPRRIRPSCPTAKCIT